MTHRQWTELKRLDALQQIKIFYMHADDKYYKHRYEEREHRFSLRSWSDVERDVILEGMVTGDNLRPQWLTDIINVAIIGGQLKRAPTGPHHAIVWFRTDIHHNLIEFIDFIDFTTKA